VTFHHNARKKTMILKGIDVCSSQYKKSDNGSEENNTPKGDDAYPCNVDLLIVSFEMVILAKKGGG